MLRFTSCQAPVAEAFAARVARYVGARLGVETAFVDRVPWTERLREFDAGRIHVCWMCGLPYASRRDRSRPALELLAALVPAGSRYRGRPVYFSDVIVRRESRWSSFAELEGATWAYNEETSHSGYNATRHRLAEMDRPRGFFGRAVATGSHEASLRAVLAGGVDATAIDSTVLDLLSARDPGLRPRLRTIDVFGPNPGPPWVIGRDVAPPVRAEVKGALLGMADDPEGSAILGSGLALRFAEVTDADYDPVRLMATSAARVAL